MSVTAFEKQQARMRVSRAVRRGALVRASTCERCAAPGWTNAHHDDYGEPLNVRWLCNTCHGIVHRRGVGEASRRTHVKGRPRIRGTGGAKLRKRNISMFDYQWNKLAKLAPNGDRSALLRQMVDDLGTKERA